MSSAHELAFKEETATDIIFQCTKCQVLIGFNKPEFGDPSPVYDKMNNSWSPPEGYEAHLDPCMDLPGDLVKAEAEVAQLKEEIAAK